MDPIPTFLDFEASSLSPNSYPIEVAWNLPDGSIESHLISPEGIADWTDWNPESEKVHGIPREELIAKGKPPAWVCERMTAQLSGRIVYTDAPKFDGMWLRRLYETSDGSEPGFELGDAFDLFITLLCPDMPGRAYGLIRLEVIRLEARNRVPNQHRAAWDVEYLVEIWKLVHWNSKSDK